MNLDKFELNLIINKLNHIEISLISFLIKQNGTNNNLINFI